MHQVESQPDAGVATIDVPPSDVPTAGVPLSGVPRTDVVTTALLMAGLGQQLLPSNLDANCSPFGTSQSFAPASDDLAITAARLALSKGRFEDAGAILGQALALKPDNPGLHKCRAELRTRLGDLDAAARDAAEALILDPTDADTKEILGALLLKLGRNDQAAACLREAVKAMPRDVFVRANLANAYAAAGDKNAAMHTLLEGIAEIPESSALRNATILMCMRRRDFLLADQMAEQTKNAGVANASTFGLKGHALSSLGRHHEAARAYREALKLAPDDDHIRQLAAFSAAPATSGAPDLAVRILFDGYADHFEQHLAGLGYRVPALIRRYVMDFAAVVEVGAVLDLGCGTGLVALALADLVPGPFTGIDFSRKMLDGARAKHLYADLREGRLPDALREETATWKLIIAADVMCYIGSLREMLETVRRVLTPNGRFIFSVEELLPNHDGTMSGNGEWASGRQGRYAHTPEYVAGLADALGFHCVALAREALRDEGGDPVVGLIMVLEKPRDE
jgi:predicted TPR repeat methyltransferase